MIEEHNSQEKLCGTVRLLPDFQSKLVQQRHISLWLPPGYDTDKDQIYSVLYAHDGQNLFDPLTSFAGVDWGIHHAMCRLLAVGAVRKTLIVGIWNTPARYREYDPQAVFESYLNDQEKAAYIREHGRPISDDYLRFIVQELKPFIDSNYRTRPGKTDTFLAGSSMGGAVSAYALCEYPEIFGGAACLSTHWPTGNGRMIDYLADRLPAAQAQRLYFDYGTETIDARYAPYQVKVDAILRQKGYIEGTHRLTRRFMGDDHSERSWRRRIDIPLLFLLK